MRFKPILLIIIIYQFTGVFAQDVFNEFKALENRVKYNYPDSLSHFSKNIDSTNVLGKAMKYWSKGKAEFWQSNYPQAYVQLEKASEVIKYIDTPNLLSEIYLDLAAALSVVDQNGKALSYLLEANELLKKSGSIEKQIEAYISLGEMYRKIGKYDEAITILRRTLPDAHSNPYNYSRCLNRMAAVFSETGKLDSSLHYSFMSLEISGSLDEPNLIATSENEIGYAYRNQGKYEKALPHFFRADSLWRSVGMLRYAINPMHHISVIYGTTFQIEKGLSITHEAYSLVKGKGWYQIEKSLMEDLKSFHQYLGNKDSVLYYDRERLQAVVNWRGKQHEINTKMVEILFTQKQNEQKIREQEALLQNEMLEKEAINRDRIFLWITISFICIILLLIFLYAYKQNRLKIELAKENNEKESKNRQLTNALEANEALVQEISHRVKNNLAVLSGFLSMQAARSNNKKVIKELNASVLRIESIATIHKKLYDKRTDAKVNLKEALTELSFNILTAMGKNPKDCLIKNIDECEIEIAKAVTFCLMINEVITNSVKYGGVNSTNKLTIQVKNLKDTVVCEVSDQGSGFEMDELDINTKSLGVYLIKLLAKQLKATISWTKTKENFIFRIKLIKNE